MRLGSIQVSRRLSTSGNPAAAPAARTRQPYDVVRVVRFRDKRFETGTPHFKRHPCIGDVGTIVEVYAQPEPGFEVECSDPTDGSTIWLEAMFLEELQPRPR